MEYNFTKNDTLIAKGLAIILMYIHHLYAFQDRIVNGNYYNSFFSLWGNTFEYWLGTFGKICVCIFMLLSGFATYKTYIANRNYDFIKSKILKFYKIYLIIFFTFIPLGYILKIRQFDFFELTNNILFLSYSYNGEWWFARSFLCMMILFPLIIKILEKNKDNTVVIDFLKIMILAIFITTILPNIMNYEFLNEFKNSQYYNILNEAATLLPSFLCGCVCAKHELFEKFRKAFKNKLSILGISFVILIIIFDFRSKTGRIISWDYIYAPLVIIASNSIIKELGIIKRICIAIGRKSTYMWLIHSFFCYYYFQYFTYWLHNSLLILLWLLVVTFLIACILDKLNKLISSHNFTLLRDRTTTLQKEVV